MTYTFKLSRRLAALPRSAMAASLLLFSACAGDGTAPEDLSDASWRERNVTVSVSPTTLTLEVNQSARFSGRIHTPLGDSVSAGVEWTVSGGTITEDGLFSSAVPGTFKVVGHGQQKADTATVLVVLVPSTLVSLVVSPATVSLAAGATQQFAAYGRMSNGDSVTVAVTYNVTGGTVNSTGLYTAGSTAGTYRVIAKANSGPADTAMVTLTAPPPPPAHALAPVPVPAPSSSLLGIPFGPFHLPYPLSGANSLPKYLYYSGILHNGAPTLAPTDPSYILNELKYVKSTGRRMVLNMAAGPHMTFVTNGVYDVNKWKAKIDEFRGKGIEPYIADGTIIAAYVVDEPNCSACRGGATMSPALVDEMAGYMKSIWPNLPTVVRVVPTWFGQYVPKNVDAAWAQWEGPLHVPSVGMTPEQFRDKMVTSAKSLGLGLIFSMNVLDGGDGSSGVAGYTPVATRWAMTAAEVKRVGSVFAAEPYACGVFAWKYSESVNDAAAMQDAMKAVAAIAANHPAVLCNR